MTSRSPDRSRINAVRFPELGMHRASRPGALALAVLAAAGCDTKGENIPVTIAKYQPPKVLFEETARIVPAPALAERPVRIGGRSWVPTATEYALPARGVRPVGTAAGMTFYALSWDAAPYDRLLLPEETPAWLRDVGAFPTRPDYWREWLEVY